MTTEETCDWDEEDDGIRSEISAKRDSINLNSLDCWDYSIELECLKGPEDLQLAAELGKTLLERNKELENSLKQCQSIIDEQTQEIEYLTKQTTALRKTNDNRIRIYENLEVSIQELERANQRLALDNATDKKQIKSLCAYRDTLEARCEELQKELDEARIQQTIQKEKLRKLKSTKEESEKINEESSKIQNSTQTTNPPTPATTTTITVTEQPSSLSSVDEDLVNQLLSQIQELKTQKSREQRKIADLEEEICRRTQDMALLEEELSMMYQREEHVKNLQEEISALEEVRSGQLCGKCLKEIDSKLPQMLLDPEDDSNVTEKYYSGIHIEIKEENPYRTLVEKYEALMEEQSKNKRHSRDFTKSSSSNCLSLQDELKLFGDLNGFNKDPEEDEESGREDNGDKKERRIEEKRNLGKRKIFSTTPTDFSEAETSSSGFSDETSNKSTQTERNLAPGSFLCSIADGDDCKFSIYDDACPIESRFRKTPEYRTLFKEIFAVLKRAAEAKDDGEKLPLLDDLTPLTEVPKVPPVTPAKEEFPADFDDVQSLPESIAVSEAASEASSIQERTPKPADETSVAEKSGPSVKPKDPKQTNDILEYLSIGISVKKKSKKRSNNSPGRRLKVSEMVEKIEESSAPSTPKRSGRRKKDWRNYDSPRNSRTQSPAVQPRVLTTLERNKNSPNGSSPSSSQQKPTSSWNFQPFVSTASQEVAKLKKLEKSYAEVLRLSPKTYTRSKKCVTSPLK